MLKAIYLTLPALLLSVFVSAQNKITIEEASKHIGEVVTICDKIYEGKFVNDSKKQQTMLELGSHFPKHNLTILINFNDRKNFTEKPEVYYVDKDICLTGKVIEVKGKPNIVVSKPSDLQIGSE